MSVYSQRLTLLGMFTQEDLIEAGSKTLNVLFVDPALLTLYHLMNAGLVPSCCHVLPNELESRVFMRPGSSGTTRIVIIIIIVFVIITIITTIIAVLDTSYPRHHWLLDHHPP